MARIRTIKPQFAEDARMASCSIGARLLFLLMLCEADDYGRLRGEPELIRGRLFPFNSDEIGAADIDAWLSELSGIGSIIRYDFGRRRYVAFRNWAKHQAVHKPGRPHHPAPPESPGISTNPQEAPGDSREFRYFDNDEEEDSGEILNDQLSGPFPESPGIPRNPPESPGSSGTGSRKKEVGNLSSSSDHLQDRAAEVGLKKREIIRILADSDLSRSQQTVGAVIGNPAAYRRACEQKRLAEDGQRIAQLVEDHPEWSAQQVAGVIQGARPPIPDYEPEGIGNGVKPDMDAIRQIAGIPRRRRVLETGATYGRNGDDGGATDDDMRPNLGIGAGSGDAAESGLVDGPGPGANGDDGDGASNAG